MTSDPIYVLDANVFIEAKNRYYAFDIAPAFWNSLIVYSANRRIQSIDRIKAQLEDGNDELAQWISDGNMGDAFADTSEPAIIASFQEMMAWVQGNIQFMDAAKATFANDPDGWLVAYAKAKSTDDQEYVVVTHEVPDPNIRRKVPIPNVCNAFDVPFMDTFAMLRALGVRFS